MYIIQTKYYGPTDHSGSRIKVTNMQTGESRWHNWNYEVNYGPDQHEHAALVHTNAKSVTVGGEDKLSYYWIAE